MPLHQGHCRALADEGQNPAGSGAGFGEVERQLLLELDPLGHVQEHPVLPQRNVQRFEAAEGRTHQGAEVLLHQSSVLGMRRRFLKEQQTDAFSRASEVKVGVGVGVVFECFPFQKASLGSNSLGSL